MYTEKWKTYNKLTPNAKYYKDIGWYNEFNIVRFDTIGDGSCLFHAIINGFFKPYHTEEINGVKMTKGEIIRTLRKELANALPMYYDKLNNGTTAQFANYIPEYKLEYMQKELDSFIPLGYGYLEFIGNILNKDIYILDSKTQYPYITDELSLSITGQRESIIIYYNNNGSNVGHYELVGIRNSDDTIDTHFHHLHPFVKFLHSLILSHRNSHT